jgi:hypothetical protein
MHHHSDNPRGTDERVLTVQGIRSSLAEFAGLYVRARERWRAYDVYLSAMLIFAASRLVVIVGINFGRCLSAYRTRIIGSQPPRCTAQRAP